MKTIYSSKTKKETGCKDSRVVLREDKENKVTPFITHIECDEAEGQKSYCWGNYFADEDAAREDYEKRCIQYSLDPQFPKTIDELTEEISDLQCTVLDMETDLEELQNDFQQIEDTREIKENAEEAHSKAEDNEQEISKVSDNLESVSDKVDELEEKVVKYERLLNRIAKFVCLPEEEVSNAN